MSEKNTAWLLAQWALWQREGVSLRMSARSPLASMAKTACGAYVASEICDDDALRVDRAMAELKRVNATWYKVLVWAYVYELGDRQVAARLNISRHAAARLYEDAYGWADARITLSAYPTLVSGERL